MLKNAEHQIAKKNIKKDFNVTELYLGDCGLDQVENLERFSHLESLWLHNNKFSQLTLPEQNGNSFLSLNYRITELHLQNNDITSIVGAVSHLRCLQVLMLQNNQLEELDHTVQELTSIHALRVINLFHNPLSQIKGYRLHIIHHLPSVTLLDRQTIINKERMYARLIYEEKQEAVKATIAFGRRSEGPPSLYHRAQHVTEPVQCSNSPVANNFLKRKSLKNIQEAISERNNRRSVMQYKVLDWSIVPTCEERRLGENVPQAQNITIRFR